ncbi:Uma2 family endonuclease [Trichocoleus sp. FACHB-262]|uniref:Uma2 family endonuclease n=1 Tax=Trichocoleus sp. FACHB-262 TaxID=2692869 RepID=UPI0016852B4A|nr:Uma2 family endonuclease [Trichocoleus sp. FACHB-262]MBD2122706.1 Uma2 family endonuclease [Trichocoleus sp. FACHB-262]
MVVQLLRRQFTVAKYHQMVEAGILTEDDRVELLEGEVIELWSISSRHAACVNRLTYLFHDRLRERAIVRVQNPVELSDRSEPQPDLVLLQLRPNLYEAGYPQAQDILLLVEVADTTVEFDQEIKMPLYAKSGVREVWLVDLNENAIAIYREPSLSGYGQVQELRRGQELTVQLFPDISLAVEKLLGQGNNFN